MNQIYASADQQTTSLLSQRLKSETATEHERMHELMQKADVFSSRPNYAQFILAQYYFQHQIEPLFKQPKLAQLIPDHEIRGREKQTLDDLNDLQVLPTDHDRLEYLNIAYPQALGWLYVSEGSTLGAAFLFKQAQKELGLSAEFGARHLAAYPEGRAKVWKRFVQALDETQFDQDQQDLVIQGALEAFDYFGQMLSHLDTLR